MKKVLIFLIITILLTSFIPTTNALKIQVNDEWVYEIEGTFYNETALSATQFPDNTNYVSTILVNTTRPFSFDTDFIYNGFIVEMVIYMNAYYITQQGGIQYRGYNSTATGSLNYSGSYVEFTNQSMSWSSSGDPSLALVTTSSAGFSVGASVHFYYNSIEYNYQSKYDFVISSNSEPDAQQKIFTVQKESQFFAWYNNTADKYIVQGIITDFGGLSLSANTASEYVYNDTEIMPVTIRQSEPVSVGGLSLNVETKIVEYNLVVAEEIVIPITNSTPIEDPTTITPPTTPVETTPILGFVSALSLITIVIIKKRRN